MMNMQQGMGMSQADLAGPRENHRSMLRPPSPLGKHEVLRRRRVLTDGCIDYVFVDEHNRHKRLKGDKAPVRKRLILREWELTFYSSNARMRRMSATEDQMRCRDNKYMALFSMCAIEVALRTTHGSI